MQTTEIPETALISGVKRFVLVAGEVSGDMLGGAIIHALRAIYPQARFYGVAGPEMLAAGCECLGSIEELSLMGLAEVLPAIPRLMRLRAKLIAQILDMQPDAVIGIDAPDFNLGLEKRLRKRGVRTVHVVSPTIWAWRPSRIKGIVKAVDLMLCLFPFEPAHYHGHPIVAKYIGHPLAETLNVAGENHGARCDLGLPEGEQPVVALLPGSRGSEMKYLAEPMVRAAVLIERQWPGARFVTPIAKPALHELFAKTVSDHAPDLDWTILQGHSREAMRAADVVLLASGTATLECLLLGRPMVVVYRGSALTAWLMLDVGLLKSRYVSLANLLTERATVTELLQKQASPEAMAEEVNALLAEPEKRGMQLAAFAGVRTELKRDAAHQAATEIKALLEA